MSTRWIILLSLLLTTAVIRSGPSSLDTWKVIPTDTIRIGDQVWMRNNLSIPVPSSFWYERDSAANLSNGRLYFFSAALAACPSGWHLPTDEEWQVLINHFGGDSLAATELLRGGSSGMELTLAGYRSANSPNDLFGKKEEQGFYWTSTVRAEQTAYARQFNVGSPVVVNQFYRRANAFSVRYIKD
jgi:uncharacterized protein (TIGR02145 family)